MTPITDHDADNIGKKPPKGRKILLPPGRDNPLSEVRKWLSDSAGLPPEVRIETVIRSGQEPKDPLTVILSNGLKLRCPHQAQLQQPRTLQAFLVSTSDGLAQPFYLSPSEAGDFYVQLCRIGATSARSDPASDLHERLTAYVSLCSKVIGSISDHAQRYVTIEMLRVRPAFSRSVALDMHNGQPEISPAVLLDQADNARYIRASEWVVYLRFVVGQTTDESGLPARMAEVGSERIDPQAWNSDRSHKVHLVLYSLPADL